MNNFNELKLPDGIGDKTINEIMNDDNTEVTKNTNKLTIRHHTEDGVITLQLEKYTHEKSLKRDKAKEVLELYNRGIPQRDIAVRLRMSNAYVSRIIHENMQ